MPFIEPVSLAGRHVAIEPLAREHEAAVKAAAADGELWRLWYTSVPSPGGTATCAALPFKGSVSCVVSLPEAMPGITASAPAS